MGISFFNPTLALFVGRLTPLPCRPIVSAMLSFNLCLLGLFWARRTFSFYSVSVSQYYRWACSHAVSGFLGPFHPFWGFLDPFYSFRHPRPTSFPQASSAHSNPSFLWAFAKSFGLPRPKLPYPLLSRFIGFSTNPIY